MGLRRAIVSTQIAFAIFVLVSAIFSETAWAQTQHARQADSVGMYHFFAEALVGAGLGSDAGNLGFGVGGRVGYAAGRSVRGTISAVVSYHFGAPVDGRYPQASVAYQSTARRLYTGVELGVQPSWRMFSARPHITFGRLATSLDCSGDSCARLPSSLFAFSTTLGYGFGVDLLASVAPFVFGVEVRALSEGPAADPFGLVSAAAFVGVSVP